MRLKEGQNLDGRYTLSRRLGSGGMADVWCAEDADLGREVALKVLHENFARDAEFVFRLCQLAFFHQGKKRTINSNSIHQTTII